MQSPPGGAGQEYFDGGAGIATTGYNAATELIVKATFEAAVWRGHKWFPF